MTPEHLERIFDRFYKADPSRTGSGSGLGLAIALENARLLGGDIEVWSEPGRGSRFTLRLPTFVANRYRAATGPLRAVRRMRRVTESEGDHETPRTDRDRIRPRRRRGTRGRRVRSGGSCSRRRSFDGDTRRPDGDGLGDTDGSATRPDRLRHVRWERVERRVGLGRPLPGLARPGRVTFRHVARAGGHAAGGHGSDGGPPRRPHAAGSWSGREHRHSGRAPACSASRFRTASRPSI